MVDATEAATVANTSISIPSPAVITPDTTATIQQKYNEERNKRLRADAASQYIDLTTSEKFKHFQEDPWVDHEALNAQQVPLNNGHNYKFLILGAGYGGLLYAVRLIQAGFPAEDIRIVDSAGGFGGTWYYNRYPGLQCDIESYIYMPLLEETGHMPEYRYAKGAELRQYANEIAEKWDLVSKAAFRIEMKTLNWDDEKKHWLIDVKQNRGPKQETRQIQVHAQFVISASGLLNYPQIPKIPGFDRFKGHVFHTSRWDYKYTGGSPTDPTLDHLKDRKVGIIGTGATAIQIVPQLAKYAKELYVFQRTPSAVDVRNNHKTDPEWWSQMTRTKNWQRERTQNFNAFMTNASPLPTTNLVNDAWATMQSYSALIGSANGIITPEMVPSHLATLHSLDLLRQQRIRDRVDSIVKNKSTAESLKTWYPGWCKRPTFHDEYLPSFNLSSVHLVDTNGAGIDSVTETGVKVKDTEYEIDVLVLATGYRSPAKGTPASRANMTIIGRNNKSLEEEWRKNGIGTLHGVISHDFPNLFFSGPGQAGVSANHMFTLDVLATHTASVLSSAAQSVGGAENFVVEATEKGQEEWAKQILMRAAAFAGVRGCTPSYLNGEGEVDKVTGPEELGKAAKGATWGEGIESFAKVLEEWRGRGDMEGLEITTC